MVMTDNVESLILEQLRRLDQRFARMEDDMGDVKLRLTATEEHLGSLMMSVAGVNARLDKIDGRVQRIERRLDLTETE
jgi:division protein CdvB (Snf7/Vps24/ESCRT-III family)